MLIIPDIGAECQVGHNHSCLTAEVVYLVAGKLQETFRIITRPKKLSLKQQTFS